MESRDLHDEHQESTVSRRSDFVDQKHAPASEHRDLSAQRRGVVLSPLSLLQEDSFRDHAKCPSLSASSTFDDGHSNIMPPLLS